MDIVTIDNTDNKIKLKQIYFTIIKNAAPIAGTLIGSLNVLAGGLIAARLSQSSSENQKYLASTTLITAEQTTLMVVFTSSLYSVSIHSGYLYGQLKITDNRTNEEGSENEPLLSEANQVDVKKKFELASTCINGCYIVIAGAVIPMTIMAFSDDIMKNLFQQDPAVSALVGKYFKSYLIGVPGTMFTMAFEQLLFGLNRQNIAFIISTTNFVIGVIAAYGLSFGVLGLPKMGIAGIGLGFTIQGYLNTLIYLCYFNLSPELRKYKLFTSTYKIHMPILKRMLSIGWPATIMVLSELLATFMAGVLCGKLGDKELAAQNFSSQFAFLVVIPIIAIAQACGQEISRAMGMQHYSQVRKIGFAGASVGLCAISLISLPVAIYPKALIYVFNSQSNEELLPILKLLMPLTCLYMMFDTQRNIFSISARGAKDEVIPAMIAAFFALSSIPLAYALGVHTSLGIYGVTAGYGLGIMLGALPIMYRFYQNSNVDKLKVAVQVEESNLPFWTKLKHSVFFKPQFTKNQYPPLEAISDCEALEMRHP